MLENNEKKLIDFSKVTVKRISTNEQFVKRNN